MARAVVFSLMAVALILGVAAVNVHLTDKLVDHMKKRTFDAFVAELQSADMDVNQPDSTGRLPLVEAVRTKDARFVDALLQYGALAKSKDPASGASPLHVAFQQNLIDISKLLLQYGADPNVDDKGGKLARDYAPSAEIRALIESYDRDGSMAFEDEPGTWDRETKDSAEAYWFNSKTSESRWNTPPSCAWSRLDVQGQPIRYVNSVTGQETHNVPAALAWVKVRMEGQEMYYNFKTNASALKAPGELPAELVASIEANINVRWYNEKSGEYSWVDPTYHSLWRELKDETTGRPYWFNVESGDSVWDLPAELAWTKVMDDTTGQHYFFNRHSGDSVWEAPDHLAWVRHDSDL